MAFTSNGCSYRVALYERPPKVDLFQQLSPWDLSPIFTSKGVFHTKSMFLVQNWHLLLNGCSYRVALYERPLISRPFPTTFPLGPIPYLHSLGSLPYKTHVFHTKLALTSERLFLQGCFIWATPHKLTFSINFLLGTHPLSSLLRGSSIQIPCVSHTKLSFTCKELPPQGNTVWSTRTHFHF